MRLNLVVVEDEPWVRRAIIEEIPLTRLGMTLAGEAETGPEAMRLCMRVQPDIVVTDIRIPGFDGLELIQRLRTELDRTPAIILISGFSDFEKAQQAIRLGAMDYLLKPVKAEQLEPVLLAARERLDRARSERLRREVSERRTLALSAALLDAQDPGKNRNMTGIANDPRIARAIAFIHDELASPLGLDEVAARVGMSRSNFALRFKESTGRTFVDYVTLLRMEKARSLLEHPAFSITEIAAMVGYADSNYFSRIFKSVYDRTPSECRSELW